MATVATSTLPKSYFYRDFAREIQPESPEGKKISDISKRIREDEPIQRLLKSLEDDNLQRHQKLLNYIDSLRPEAIANHGSEFSLSVLKNACQVWENLRELFSSKHLYLEVPDACPGYRDNFMYNWSKGEHYLECEIFGGGEVEFFYRNDKNNEIWGEDITVDQGFSTTILNKVALFAW